MSSAKQRVEKELEELEEKVKKLKGFYNSPTF